MSTKEDSKVMNPKEGIIPGIRISDIKGNLREEDPLQAGNSVLMIG
jgi:hypothetical protein